MDAIVQKLLGAVPWKIDKKVAQLETRLNRLFRKVNDQRDELKDCQEKLDDLTARVNEWVGIEGHSESKRS